MYSSLQLAFKYLNYYLTASNGRGHGIHSPFVYDLVTKVLNDKTQYPDYEKVEDIRRRAFRDKTVLTIEDYGAGSSSQRNHRSVSSIAKRAVKAKKYGQLLYRLVKYYQPKIIIELGTSLGVTAGYLSLGAQTARLFTLEGATDIANKAKQNFRSLQLENVTLIEGNFDYTLPAVIYRLQSADLVFIDGNHRREPTLNYLQWLMPKVNHDSIFIFDDIHWSREMEQAWDEIKNLPRVCCTVDLFFIGMVFFRPEFKEKQHFTIRF